MSKHDPFDDHAEFARDCAEIAMERYCRGELSRRTLLKGLAALGLAPAAGLLGSGSAAAAEQIVIVNWGGPALTAYDKAWGAPYKSRTGTKVRIDGTGPSAGKIRAMVEAKKVTWDVCDSGAGTTLLLGDGGFIEEMDWDIVDKSQVRPEFVYPWGIVNYMFSFVLAYNKKKLGDAVPKNWADFWNVKDFPGKRTLRKNAIGMIEAAMMADGVPANEVYAELGKPGAIDRAMNKFKEIRDHVIIWNSGSMSQQLFREGEVVMGNIWHTRANLLRRDMKGDVGWTWEGGVCAPGVWVVPKGNPAGKKAAMEFINYALEPEGQVVLFEAMGNGPCNPKAAALVPDELRQYDPGQPENYARQLPFGAQWYRKFQIEANEKYIDMMSV